MINEKISRKLAQIGKIKKICEICGFKKNRSER